MEPTVPTEPIKQPDKAPNWRDILQERYPQRTFILENDPDKVRDAINEAVFKTLTGRRLEEYNRRRIGDVLDERSGEKAELNILNLHEELFSALQDAGFEDEAKEALRQSQLAVDSLGKKPKYHWDHLFMADYDYWKSRGVKEAVRIRNPENDPFLTLEAPVEKIGGIEGFPRKLLEIRWEKQPASLSDDLNGVESMFTMLEGLGITREQLIENYSFSKLFDIFWGHFGSTEFEKLEGRFDIKKPDFNDYDDMVKFDRDYKDYRREFYKFAYKQLAPDQQKKLTDETVGYFTETYPKSIKDGAKVIAEQSITASVDDAPYKYNPETGLLDIDFNRANLLKIYLELVPKLTPETRHDQLLAAREKTLRQTTAAGLN